MLQEIALALAEYRRVMDAYYQTYCEIPPLGDFYEMSPDALRMRCLNLLEVKSVQERRYRWRIN